MRSKVRITYEQLHRMLNLESQCKITAIESSFKFNSIWIYFEDPDGPETPEGYEATEVRLKYVDN